MIGAVLFDLDETLLDRTTSLRAFLRDQFDRFSGRLGPIDREAWQAQFLALDQRGKVHKRHVYPAILAAFHGDPAAAPVLLADYAAHCARFATPFAGMAATIAAVRALGLPIGIVTNGETEFQTRHVQALGLHRLVDAILISEREGLRKPDLLLFHRAADRLHTPPEQCLFVGDNPVADILGASAAGMRTAWFRGSAPWPIEQPANPGDTIEALEDILHLLQRDRAPVPSGSTR